MEEQNEYREVIKENIEYEYQSCGYDAQGKQVVQSMTWTPEKGMTARQIEKEVNKQAIIFEESCLKGFQTKVVKFEPFAEEWFEEYAKTNLRNTTYERLLQLKKITYKAIGHLRMDKITARQIQTFISSLSKDVDFENNIISVKRTSCFTLKKRVYTDTTKTKKSQRTMKFPQEIMNLLKQLREKQGEQALKIGDKWVETDRVFTRWNGEPANPNSSYKWLERFCKINDLPFYGLHSYRHFFASCLVNEGVDIVSVSGALGHSVVSTTSNIYCHILENSRSKVSDAIANALKFGA